jgi:predicted metal-dependent phosphoesterase TrpH
MPSRVDLHTHTTASDGTLTPPELFQKALELGVQVLAISDHDSTAGYEAVLPLTSQHPEIRLLPAIELNAEGPLACHLLGYFIDIHDAAFQRRLAEYRTLRVERIRKMAQKLNDLGVPVDFNRVMEMARGGAVGRPHLADALMEKGLVKSRQEAFDRYLKKGGTAYFSGDSPTAEEGIQLIRSVKGIPVLAHPSYYTSPELLEKLVAAGLMGIEAYYPEHSRGLIEHYKAFAEERHLLLTGGSDFHGPRTGRAALAGVHVPDSVVESLEKARDKV